MLGRLNFLTRNFKVPAVSALPRNMSKKGGKKGAKTNAPEPKQEPEV